MLVAKRVVWPVLVVALVSLTGCHSTARSDKIGADPAPSASPDGGPSIVVALASDRTTATLDGKRVALDDLSDAFKSTSFELPVRFEGDAAVPWGTVVRAVDLMKMSGRGSRGMSFAVSGDRARRTAPLFLPKAVSSESRGFGLLAPDGAVIDRMHSLSVTKNGTFVLNGNNVAGPLAPALSRLTDLHGGAVSIEADRDAPFGTIVDAVLLTQRNGATPVFGVRVPAPEPVPPPR